MNKHYITVDGNSLVTKAFSDAFEQRLDTDICVNENGGRHYNLNLTREDGLPKYKYIDGVFTETTEDDFPIRVKHLELEVELQKILDWMDDTDYIPNKIVREDWLRTDKRYITYTKEYNIKHSRKEEIQLELEVA